MLHTTVGNEVLYSHRIHSFVCYRTATSAAQCLKGSDEVRL